MRRSGREPVGGWREREAVGLERSEIFLCFLRTATGLERETSSSILNILRKSKRAFRPFSTVLIKIISRVEFFKTFLQP